MSRIILSKYPGTDESHIVVGWDRPLSTYYWQEFNKEPDKNPESGEVDWGAHPEWEEMLGYAGYMPNELPTLLTLMDSAPAKVKLLITPAVQQMLREHSQDPNTGSVIVDLAPQSFKVEVQTHGDGDKWSSNALRFATEAEAEQAALDLASRWYQVKEHRVVPSTDPVNYKWEEGRAVAV